MFLAGFTKENVTTALDQSALTELLDALRAGGDIDLMRDAMQLVLQELMLPDAATDICAFAVFLQDIGARPGRRTRWSG